ncbi:MAG: hypothetical protein Q3983_01065 [Capnocytophaga sp.]|nr:hypothetical protein [Capnocytophaga sp.]
MTKKKKEISIWHWKKILFVCCITFVATFLQLLWALKDFTGSVSSADASTSLPERILSLSLLTLLFVGIFFLRGRLWNSPFDIPIFTGLLVLCWFYWDYQMFVDYEASWSTYSRSEILFYTLQLSFLPILVIGLSFYFALRWFLYHFFVDKK